MEARQDNLSYVLYFTFGCRVNGTYVFIIFIYTDDVLGMLLNIEENKVAFYLNGEAIERDFPARNR